MSRGEVMNASADGEFVAFDLEATGLSLSDDRIIEVGAQRFRRSGEVTASFDRLINPHRASGPAAMAVHRIDDAALSREEPAAVVLPGFLGFLGESSTTTLVAHNAAFDAGLLGRELTRAGLPLPGHRVIDTLAWSRRVWPSGSHRLDALARVAAAEEAPNHRALADSDRVRRVFGALLAADLSVEDRPPLAYPIYDPSLGPPTPCGWEPVAAAMARGEVVRLVYEGGSRGAIPRDLTPIRFEQRGGTAYLVAKCHLDEKTKSFQVDRFRPGGFVGGDQRTKLTGDRAGRA